MDDLAINLAKVLNFDDMPIILDVITSINPIIMGKSIYHSNLVTTMLNSVDKNISHARPTSKMLDFVFLPIFQYDPRSNHVNLDVSLVH